MIPSCAIGQKCAISPYWMKRTSQTFAHGTAFQCSVADRDSPDDQTKFDDDVRAKKKAAMARLSCGVDMAVSANKDARF